MEASDLGKHFSSRSIPDVNIDEFTLSKLSLFATTSLVASRPIQSFASHLACSNDVFIWMHSHGNDILVMQVEEFLCLSLDILDDTNASSREDDATISSISQVTSSVKAAESVSPLECQVVVWCLAHGSLKLEAIRYGGLDLAAPNIDTTSLITFFKLELTKLVVTARRGSSEGIATVVIVIFFDFVEAIEVLLIIIVISLSDLCGVASSCLIHKVSPLEDSLVFATSRDQEFLTLIVS